MQSKIFIVYFNNATLAEYVEIGERKIFSSKTTNGIRANDMVVFINKDTNSVVAVGVAGGSLQPRHLLDQSVYSARNSKYQSSIGVRL